MSAVSVQSVSPLPLMHMSSTEEPALRGTLPEGKTLEKVLYVFGEIFKNAILSSDDRLKQRDMSVDDLFKLSRDKQSKKFTESWVVGVLGGLSGVATVASGLGFVAAPWVQQLRPGLALDEATRAVKKAAEGVAGFSRTGSDVFKTYQEGLIGEIDTRYSIEQSVALQSSQQSYMALHQFVTKVQEMALQILTSQNRASGG